MQRGADGERDAPEEVAAPEAEDADDGEVGGEAVHGGAHDDPSAVPLAGGRGQPRPRERRAHAPRGAVVLPVRLRELGRLRLVLGHGDDGSWRGGLRRARGGRRGGGVVVAGGGVGVAVLEVRGDVEAVGYAEAVEAREREDAAEEEQVEEEEDEPEDVVAAAPGRPRPGPRRVGARVPAVGARGGGRGGGGRRHGGDRRSARGQRRG